MTQLDDLTAAVAEIGTAVKTVQTDVDTLEAEILAAGTPSPQVQAAIDSLKASSAALAKSHAAAADLPPAP